MSNATDIRTMVTTMLTDLTTQANALAEANAKSQGSINRTLKEMREDENTTDENVRKYQEVREALLAKLNEHTDKVNAYLANKIGVQSVSEDEAKANHESYKSLRSNITQSRKLLEMQPGFDESWIAEVPVLLNWSTGKPSGQRATSSGGFRPRLDSATVNGESFATFSEIASHINSDAKLKGDERIRPSDLHIAALESANADNFDGLRDVDFNYSVNGSEYEISIVLKNSDEE